MYGNLHFYMSIIISVFLYC